MIFFKQTLNILIDLLSLLVLLRVVFSWFQVSSYHPLAQFIFNASESFLAPIRRLLPSMGPLDFTPIVFFLILGLVRALLNHSL